MRLRGIKKERLRSCSLMSSPTHAQQKTRRVVYVARFLQFFMLYTDWL